MPFLWAWAQQPCKRAVARGRHLSMPSGRAIWFLAVTGSAALGACHHSNTDDSPVAEKNGVPSGEPAPAAPAQASAAALAAASNRLTAASATVTQGSPLCARGTFNPAVYLEGALKFEQTAEHPDPTAIKKAQADLEYWQKTGCLPKGATCANDPQW